MTDQEYGKLYRERNKERIAQKKKEWRLANPDKVYEHNRKANEKRRKPRVPLTKEQILERKLLKRIKDAEYYQENKHWLQENRTKYYFDNRLAQALRNIKYKCKKKNIPFDLDISLLKIPEVCPVLGIPIFPGVGKLGPNSPSLDRIIPEKGYVDGNVRVISNRANMLKSNMTLEEARLIYNDIKEIHGELG